MSSDVGNSGDLGGDQPHAPAAGPEPPGETGEQPTAAETDKPGGRRKVKAGRDLPAAIAVGAVLGAVVVVPLFTVKQLWVAIVAVAIGIGTYEVVRALGVGGRAVPLVPLAAGGTAMPVAAYAGGPAGLVVALAVTVVVASAWRCLAPPAGAGPNLLADLAAVAFAAGYVGFPAGFATLLAAPADGPRRALAFLVTVVASDIGGYAAGVLSGGRHKLAPKVSPGKSWEGFAGSTVACVAAGIASTVGPLHTEVWQGALLGLATVCAATVGDLGESLIKRDIGIKDMGHLLPGHGGIMDRLDSLLCSAPVAWLLISAFTPG